MIRRLAAVAAAVGVTLSGAVSASAATPSGALLDWSANPRMLSTDARFTTAQTAGVWLYGDSITVNDARALAVSMPELTVAVDATPGIPTSGAVGRLEERVATQGAPEVLVMATGSNDIFDPGVMFYQVARVRQIVGPATRVVWVNVRVQRWAQPADVQLWDLRNSGRVNGLISMGDVDTTVRWAEFLAAKPGRPAYYLSDGVHTNANGRAARNALIAATVRGN